MKLKYGTTSLTGKDGTDKWGVVIEEFNTEKEAKDYIKELKKGK